MQKPISPGDEEAAEHTLRVPKLTSAQTLMDVARSFYIDEEPKGAIAKRLNVTERRVRQWLKEAKDRKFVRIDLYDPPNAATEHLANEVKNKFDLQMVKVIPSRKVELDSDYAALLRRWGYEAAAFFDNLVDQGQELHVGISGGETLLEFVNALPDRPRKDVYVYATTLVGRGRLTMSASHVDAQVNGSLLWAKCGREPGHNRYATVPPYDGSASRLGIAKELESMSHRRPIEAVIREMDEINLAFVGLGLINPPQGDQRHIARLTMLSVIKPLGVTAQGLADEGAIGEMGGSLFDKNGETRKEWRFFLSAGYYHPKGGGIEFYKRMVADGKRVVVIGGVQKEKAILAALKAKAFNHWFTDEATARMVLEAS